MEPGTGDRGVSEVMGFILVFGMLVLSFTIYQGIVVPDQNRQAEFEHNQNVQGQLQDLRNAIVSTSATGSGQAVSVKLGASYPTRALAQNLGISAGSIQTTSADIIRIENVRALDPETRDYLDGGARTFETKSIRYTPVYSFYSGAPETMYENTVTFNQFGNTNLTLTDQVVIDGRRITLIAINGSLSRSQQDTVSISTEAISTSSNRIGVKNTSGDRINITIPTKLSVSEWEQALEDELGSSGNVEGVYDVDGEEAVNLSLEQGVYELRMAKIGVGDLTSEEPAKYITSREGDGANVPEGGTQEIVVEVRDRFNNPVSDVTVSGNVTSVSPLSGTTGGDGRVRFTYTAPANGPEDVDIEFSFDGDGTDNETAIVSLKVLDSDGSAGAGGGGAGNINPNEDDAVVLVEEVFDDGGVDCGNNDDCRVTITLDNKGSETRSIEDIRYNFYSVDSQGGGGGGASVPGYVQINGQILDLRGEYADVGSPQLPSGETTLSMCFFTSSSISSNNAFEVDFGDFYILSVRFDDNSQATYFIPPVSGTPSSVDYDCDAGESGLNYNSDASTSDGTGQDSAVEFSITNQHNDDMTITAITVEDSTSGDQIRETELGDLHEVMIDTDGDGDADGDADAFFSGYQVGDVINLGTTPTIPSGGTADITFYEFQDSGDNAVDMSGEEITVTVDYEDGGGNTYSETFTISIP